MVCMMICYILLGLDLYFVDPVQPLTTAGEELDDLGHDLSDLPVRGGGRLPFSEGVNSIYEVLGLVFRLSFFFFCSFLLAARMRRYTAGELARYVAYTYEGVFFWHFFPPFLFLGW